MSRFSSVEGLLNSPPRATPKPVLVQPAEDEVKKPPRARPEQALASRQAKPKSSEASGGNRRVPIGMDPSLKDRLRRRAADEDTTQSNVVRDAIEAAEVGGQFKDAFAEKPTGSLFKRHDRPGPRPTFVFEMRVSAGESDIIDQLVSTYGAKDRTALIVRALELHLG